MTLAWKEDLQKKLIHKYDQKKGSQLSKKYAHAFSNSYMDYYSPEVAQKDIKHMELLGEENQIETRFYVNHSKNDHPLHLKLYQWQDPIPLSDVLPMLENMGLRTLNERQTRIKLRQHHQIFISDFAVTCTNEKLQVQSIQELFDDAFTHVYFGLAENDGFNKLILAAKLNWRQIMIIRTYAKYLHQVHFRFSQAYIEKALLNNLSITNNLVNLFLVLHDPKSKNVITKASKLEEDILSSLDQVMSLDEDRIIRRLLELIKATLRTNYFQKDKNGNLKTYLSIKLNSRTLSEMPLPIPLFEIFVYSPRFEGIHLRNTKVARGGIRWSDRREDFRTEILGLMKAQVVKNSIIVPSGAKGGFALKKAHEFKDREELMAEVIESYTYFISGLLDLTDNIVHGKTVHPKEVVCYDDDDSYLVVAADKGTATFSDLANNIAKKYDFWLGDAFASGGATGYDHKKMGITARGAWESIKRHFRELQVDPLKTSITVAGIGDMSGDVFGNGMIYSKKIKLVAAFDHRHIFIDPDPDPAISYKERLRLFNLSNSSWEDYNSKLLSKGGGIYKRSLKSIPISVQARKVLQIDTTSLTPTDLIRAILCAPVDLLYNGGIGTYVKAKGETHAEVGDRANEYTRVNGSDLRCRVVGEGGNLGFTQLGRVEYALKGGLINTDFIDNSAGVDCSDHEVNLKILLNQEVKKKKLTEKNRNQLLASVTDEVAILVLKDNYYQALIMSFSAFHAKKNIGLHTEYIKELETQGVLNRQVEYLPDDKQLVERKADGIGLTRPELAVLLAYTKIYLKQSLCNSFVPEDPYLATMVEKAFPPTIRKKYKKDMLDHRLHREIIANEICNYAIDEMGITFVYRLQMETAAYPPEIIRAYTVASAVFNTRSLRKLIENLNYKISLHEQYEMLYNIRQLCNLATRWFLRSTHLQEDLEKIIEHFSVRIKKLAELTPKLMSGYTRVYLDTLIDKFTKAGLPEESARKIATYRAIYTSLNIIDVATKHNLDLEKTAYVYFSAGERVHLLWFRDQIANDSREGHWNVLARLTLRDELDLAQRSLTISILRLNAKEKEAAKLIDKWVEMNKNALDRWEKLLALLHSSNNVDYTMFFIAMRELLNLIMTSNSQNLYLPKKENV